MELESESESSSSRASDSLGENIGNNVSKEQITQSETPSPLFVSRGTQTEVSETNPTNISDKSKWHSNDFTKGLFNDDKTPINSITYEIKKCLDETKREIEDLQKLMHEPKNRMKVYQAHIVGEAKKLNVRKEILATVLEELHTKTDKDFDKFETLKKVNRLTAEVDNLSKGARYLIGGREDILSNKSPD